MLDLKQLHSFTFGCGYEGVSYTILEMTSTELIRVCDAFRHLTTINLPIDTQDGKQRQRCFSAKFREVFKDSGPGFHCVSHGNPSFCEAAWAADLATSTISRPSEHGLRGR